jgi:hypothetical protein
MSGSRWSRDERIVVLDLYRREGLLDAKHPKVVALATLMGRTGNAVSMKLANWAHLDPAYSGRGLSSVGETDQALFAQLWAKPQVLASEAQVALTRL